MIDRDMFSRSSAMPYAVGGAILCLLMPLFDILLWGLPFLCALIVAFGCFGFQDKQADRREVADNCYMLGFLYTLMMIVATLLISFAFEDDLRAISDKLIYAIAIAMATSAIGMLLRIVILSMLVDPPNHLDKEFMKIVHQLGGLAVSIDNSQKATAAFIEGMNGMLVSIHNYRSGLEEEASHMGAVLDAHAVRVASQLASGLTEKLNVVELSERLKLITQLLGEVGNALNDMPRIAARASTELNTLPDAATNAGSGLRDLGVELDAAKVKLGNVDAAVSQLLVSINSMINGLPEEAEKASKALNENLGEQATAHSEILKNTLEELKADLKNVRMLKSEYQQEVDNARAEVTKQTCRLYSSLNEGADAALNRLEDMFKPKNDGRSGGAQ